jgi:hypothetical protein
MNLETLIAHEIDRACEQLCDHGVTRRMSEEALRRRLETFAARVAADARSVALLSIRSAEDAAEAWGVSVRRAQAHIAWLNDRQGIGARIGRAWMLTEDEITRHAPGPTGVRRSDKPA